MNKSPGLNSAFLTIEVFLLLLGQLGRINMPYGISFYALEAVIFFHTSYVLATKPQLLKTIKSNIFAKIGLWWLVFVILVLLTQSFLYTFTENIRAVSYLLRVSNFAALALFVAPNVGRKMGKNILNVISFFLPLVALAQYVLLPDLRFMASYGWDPHMYRAVGTIFDPPIMGSILGMLFIYKIIKIEKYKNTKFDRIILKNIRIIIIKYTNLLLLYFSIIFLYSRSTYLAVLIASSSILFIRRKYFLLIYFFIIFLLSIYLAPQTIPAYRQLESAKLERISTVTSRKTEILAGLVAFAKNPVWGIGYNRVREYKNKSSVDSSQLSVNNQTILANNHAGSAFHSFWVTQAATTGIVGLVLLVWFFAEVVRKNPNFLPILFVPSFIGLFDNTMFHPFVLIILILLFFSFQSQSSDN